MTYSISASNGAGTSEPVGVEGYNPRRESRNKIHDLLDGSIGVSFIAPRPRSGALRLLYVTEATAAAALALHAQETSFTLTSSDVALMGMTYVLDGSLDLDLDAEHGLWWVEVGFQEVTP